MKKLTGLILISLFSVTALAAAPEKAFVGKYEYNYAGDSSCMWDSSRVYVSVQEDISGDQVISIDTYSQEVITNELLLGSGKRVSFGAKNLTETWTSEFVAKNHFVCEIRTTGVSFEQPVDYTVKYELILKGDKLTFVYDDGTGDTEVCEMTRIN